ncbi:MAG TPA: hypothetical protein DIT58_01565 [Porticoccaceae bacterium]|nr:hypothetical protein [Porticoccaceae bacterium]
MSTILEGLGVAIANIDAVIELIKASSTPADARENLLAQAWMPGEVTSFLERADQSARPDDLSERYGLREGRYYLSPEQAQAILELRLHRLTGMEHEKLLEEYSEKLDEIAGYLTILNDPNTLMDVIRTELEEIDREFGDERRTEIIDSRQDLTVADLIPVEDRVVTISHGGYAKTQPLADYHAQRRGGTGRSATAVKDEDFVEYLLIASTHDTILCFSNAGKVYWLKVYEIPVASRGARGRPMVNLLPLEENERITSILPVSEYSEDHYVFMATSNGTVKKTELTAFSRPRSVGLRALELEEGDRLVGTAITDGKQEVMLFCSTGKATRFQETDVRAMGRTARGVRGIKVPEGERVISLIIPEADKALLAVCKNGYGKRTPLEEFSQFKRGGQGVIAIQTSERNGQLVAAVKVSDKDEIMLISDQGTLVRTAVDEVPVQGRNTQGVRLIRVRGEESLVDVAVIREEEVDGEAAETGDAEAGDPGSEDAGGGTEV